MRRGAGALALAALLTACATLRPEPPSPHDALAGRLAVRVAAHAGQPARSVSAAFELRGGADRGELDLTTPLGTTLAKARWRPGRAELVTSDGITAFDDLAALASEALGEALPLAALFDWLRGRPWGGAPHAAHTGGFEQLGWRVEVADEGAIVARRPTPPEVTVRARIDRP